MPQQYQRISNLPKVAKFNYAVVIIYTTMKGHKRQYKKIVAAQDMTHAIEWAEYTVKQRRAFKCFITRYAGLICDETIPIEDSCFYNQSN